MARFPKRMSPEDLFPIAYLFMYLARRLEERVFELYQKGCVKGTVTIGIGNEATTVGMSIPFRPGKDVVSLLHRDFAAHLLFGATPRQLLCQYLANVESPTHGREGNVHHGDASRRRLPMISHLGKMLSLVVGGTWGARQNGEDVFGLAAIGDGGSSTGEFHEAMNIASVLKVPVLFLIENNHYAFSTPTSAQYRCARLSDRAIAYGIRGRTIDGTDVGGVYDAVFDAMESMQRDSMPVVIECMSLRLHGHAAYDKATYVDPARQDQWQREDPLPNTRRRLRGEFGLSEADVDALECEAEAEIHAALAQSLRRAARAAGPRLESLWRRLRAVGEALPCGEGEKRRRRATGLGIPAGEQPPRLPCRTRRGSLRLCFQDLQRAARSLRPRPGDRHAVGRIGNHGVRPGRVADGRRADRRIPIRGFLHRVRQPVGAQRRHLVLPRGGEAPILVRLPCGGGLTMGAFHSGEFEGLWSRFPGLKLLYPATPQETFEALLAGFYDRNPCLVFEHKLLYWSHGGDIDFDGDLSAVCARGVTARGPI